MLSPLSPSELQKCVGSLGALEALTKKLITLGNMKSKAKTTVTLRSTAISKEK